MCFHTFSPHADAYHDLPRMLAITESGQAAGIIAFQLCEMMESVE